MIMRINGYDDLIHRYSRTAEALRAERSSGFDDVLRETAERYSRSLDVSGHRDPLLAFSSRTASSPGYDPVLHYGDA